MDMTNAPNGSSNASALFDVFVQAKTALEELPKVQADLAHAHSNLNDTIIERDLEREAKEKAEARITQLQAALAQREADLAHATFRSQQDAQLLDGLRGLLGISNSAPVSVAPQVSPAQAPAEAETYPRAAATDGDKRETDPTAPSTNAQSQPASTPDTASGIAMYPTPEAHPQPTEVPNSGPTLNPSPDLGTQSTATDPEWSHVTPISTSGHSDAAAASVPTQEHDTAQVPTPSHKDWFTKPNAMTWRDWKAQGGEVPSWAMNEYDA